MNLIHFIVDDWGGSQRIHSELSVNTGKIDIILAEKNARRKNPSHRVIQFLKATALALFFVLALMPGTLMGQTETTLRLEFQPNDTTWYFTEIQRVDGKKVSERLLPETGQTLTKEQFQAYASALVRSEKERLDELKRLESKVEKNIVFLGNALDSVCGEGTAKALDDEAILQKLQGAWTLLSRVGGSPEPEFRTITIAGTNAATKDKTAVVTVKNRNSFTLERGIFDFKLSFDLSNPDRFVAERTDSKGVVTKYTLRR